MRRFVGSPIPRASRFPPARRRQVDRDESLFRVNQEAARFYNEMLKSPEGRVALKYLEDRGIDAKAIEEFQLGYSPKGRDRLRTHLSTLDANLGHASQAGLLRSDDEGNVRDFFFGRLMVPILDRRGRVAGFGGRSLDGSNPKYINTPLHADLRQAGDPVRPRQGGVGHT